MLKKFVVNEILPGRIFQLLLKRRLITHIVGVFEIMQRDHQTGRQRWTAFVRAEKFSLTILEIFPVACICGFDQRMIFGNAIKQKRLKKMALSMVFVLHFARTFLLLTRHEKSLQN